MAISVKSLKKQVNDEFAAATRDAESSLVHLGNVGGLLVTAKEKLPHGEFGQWVDANCPFKHRQARKYMRFYREMPNIQEAAKLSCMSVSSLNDALDLVSEGDSQKSVTENGSENGQGSKRHSSAVLPTEIVSPRADAMRAIRSADHQFAEQVDAGDVSITDEEIEKLGGMKKSDMRDAIKDIRVGHWNPETNGKAAIVLDALKRAVPEHLTEQHDVAASISSLGTRFDQLRREVEELSKYSGGAFIHTSEIAETLISTKRLLTNARYYTECPKCCGKPKSSCKRCAGNGFIPFAAKGQLSSEEQEWLSGQPV